MYNLQLELSHETHLNIRGDNPVHFQCGWTSSIYEYFHMQYPSCSLAFKSSRTKKRNSPTRVGAFWTAYAKCVIVQCIKVTFKIRDEPTENTIVMVHAIVYGTCCYPAEETNINRNPKNAESSGILHKRFSKSRQFWPTPQIFQVFRFS